MRNQECGWSRQFGDDVWSGVRCEGMWFQENISFLVFIFCCCLWLELFIKIIISVSLWLELIVNWDDEAEPRDQGYQNHVKSMKIWNFNFWHRLTTPCCILLHNPPLNKNHSLDLIYIFELKFFNYMTSN